MLVLIGLLGGFITGISPCIIPVLPVILFSGGMQSARTTESVGVGGTAVRTQTKVSRFRPYAVIAGLVTSFSLMMLAGTFVLSLLNLPQDILRWAGIIVLVMIGIGLLLPQVQHLLEKPFSRLPSSNLAAGRSGFPLGLALGAVYVPCAGPVLAAIAVAGTTGNISAGTVVLTVSFAVGAAIPLLFFALAGRGIAERVKAFRRRQRTVRIVSGVTMLALAIGLVFNLPAVLQRAVPDITAGLQQQLAQSDEVAEAIGMGNLVNDENRMLDQCEINAVELGSCGPAPSFRELDGWFNTPGDQPVEIDDLQGQVVLLDFWAYSCINCQRSLPHVQAWYETYEDAGLSVVGIHSPEYSFEREARNVRAGAREHGLTYPIAQDNNLATWTQYRNRFWPAHYLIDAEGTVRSIHFGEGNYEAMEDGIRELLRERDPDVQLPGETDVQDQTPDGNQTPETFLGTTKIQNFGGEEAYSALTEEFSYPEELARNTFALDGSWELGTQSITPRGDSASVTVEYTGREVRMVLAGEGSVTVDVDGDVREIEVGGTPNSYELLLADEVQEGRIEVTLPNGVEAYSFTFG